MSKMRSAIKNSRTWRDIAALVERSLSQPGIKAGQRLRPERELAELLGVSHSCIHRALEHLESQGVLAHRHGSGNFIRKPAVIPPDSSGRSRVTRTTDLIATSLLLAKSDASQQPLRPLRSQQGLRLGLWTDIYWNSTTHNLMLAGIKKRCAELGHEIHHHAIVSVRDQVMETAEISAQLAKFPADGHIVYGPYAEEFRRADPEHSPTIYYGGEPPSPVESAVRLDFEAATARAVNLLADSGYRRIALLTLRDSALHAETMKRMHFFYEAAARQRGLETCEAIAAQDYSPQAVLFSFQRVFRSKTPPPDAIYVTDDHFLEGVSEMLPQLDLHPGKNFGIITVANFGGLKLPPSHPWSTLEFDPEQYGEILVGRLAATIQTSGSRPVSLSLHARWSPGRSHLRA